MKTFITLIRSSYLQRTRSYAFLITLCISLAIAYTFVPEPEAQYSTIRIADHVGYYNASWFGYVTAIMTSVFLSLIGFYLVNNAIKTDVETKVGQIVASTRVNNFTYLFSKVISNFMVLLTIVIIVLCMSILLFFLYNEGYPFEFIQFLKPYCLITVPAMFVISVIAILFETVFGKYSILQNILFFFLFSALTVYTPKNEFEFGYDIFGTKIVINDMEHKVRDITNSSDTTDLTIGYVMGNITSSKKFHFEGTEFPLPFILSRLVWILLGTLIIIITSSFFHRFRKKEGISVKKTTTINYQKKHLLSEFSITTLSKPQINFGILPLLKTEILLLIRKGKKWLWILNVIGMILIAILPLATAHKMVLPILWFLQVHRISELVTKETYYQVHYLSFTSYKPIFRLLLSQVLAAIALMLFIASPLIFKLLLIDAISAISIILGGILIVAVATTLGIISKGKKLFEILFFLLTYANINGIPFLDYFGAFSNDYIYLLSLSTLAILLLFITFLARKYQISR